MLFLAALVLILRISEGSEEDAGGYREDLLLLKKAVGHYNNPDKGEQDEIYVLWAWGNLTKAFVMTLVSLCMEVLSILVHPFAIICGEKDGVDFWGALPYLAGIFVCTAVIDGMLGRIYAAKEVGSKE